MPALMADLVSAGVSILTIGQYLRQPEPPAAGALLAAEEFETLRQAGLALGLAHVEAGPLVRSSYHAAEQEATAGGRPFEAVTDLPAPPNTMPTPAVA